MEIGAVVRFREREWVVLGVEEGLITLRPVVGLEKEYITIHEGLARAVAEVLPAERIEPASFPWPEAQHVGSLQQSRLFWQAARLLLREGAAPFRSLGRISVRPRPYQLVPLLMALRLAPVRMLIADDVGVGKTIEAGLILRELWDRREIQRFAVLCPPYLTDQWQQELAEKFHLETVVITPATLARLERGVPPGQSLYQYYPGQVISVDFIKHERNKNAFLLYAPELLIVDEAHGVTPGRGQDRHLRYNLVRELAQDRKRHLLLLTATPHSGIAEAFQKLVGLLDPEFESWDFSRLTEPQRARLARHFVQRTRRDIQDQWEAALCFPRRETIEATYTLSPAYRRLFEAVYDFCTEIVQSGQELERHRRRMRWWAALALLRCVMSSPRAALVALQKRHLTEHQPSEDLEPEAFIPFVYEPTDQVPDDEVPTPLLNRGETHLTQKERKQLRDAARLVGALTQSDDTKIQGCIQVVQRLLKEKHNPIIYCFYIETAEYVAQSLRAALAKEGVSIECLTGRVGEQERRLRVQQLLAQPAPRILVATDCLSEGINLQKGFDAVIHYDLPWNPNRLEQREGRVDRFEQPSPIVKVVRYYGEDNPVDGAVIRVLLNKAREIRQALGTHVPIFEEEERVIEALVHDLFFRSKASRYKQLALPFEEAEDQVKMLHASWQNDMEREKQSRTRFAQHALKPKEVQQALEATDQVLGDPKAVQDFVLSACQALKIPVQPRAKEVWEVVTELAALHDVPEQVREALPSSRRARWRITFTSPTPEGAEYIGRNHPFVAALARHLFERALAAKNDDTTIARCGVIYTAAVDRLTVILFLRPRFELIQPERPSLLAEEVLVVGWQPDRDTWLPPSEALPLLQAEPTRNMDLAEKQRLLAHLLERLKPFWQAQASSPLQSLLAARAQELEEAHRRLRAHLELGVRGLKMRPCGLPDLLGVLVLQPEGQPFPSYI